MSDTTSTGTGSTTVERIIAKIDNDFNPDNSDWIPRVGAWCIDAMSQIDVLRTKKKKKKLIVKDRIAYSECDLGDISAVYDSNGCEVKEADDSTSNSSCGCSSTGESDNKNTKFIKNITPGTVDLIDTGNEPSKNYVVAGTINDKFPYRYNVTHYSLEQNPCKERTYTKVDCDKLEINFDDDYICVESEGIETETSSTFGCEVPVIPNNGLLIEAIVCYCMYKMLCRGYQHPVMNLAASQYGTNPYYMWTQLKEEAKRSVNAGNITDDVSKIWRSSFIIDMFDPRR